MLFRKNVGSREGLARGVGGALIVAWSLLQIGTTPLGWVLAGSGVMLMLTGVLGYCPACAVAGRKPLDSSP